MSNNIKFFAILTVVFLVGGGIVFKAHETLNAPERVLNKVAEPMIKDLAASKWSGEALRRYATPEFQGWMVENHITNGMPGFGVLGNVKKYLGIKQINTNENVDFAAFVSEVQFDKATAYVTLQLSKRNGQWLIYSFNVDSPLFKNAARAQNSK